MQGWLFRALGESNLFKKVAIGMAQSLFSGFCNFCRSNYQISALKSLRLQLVSVKEPLGRQADIKRRRRDNKDRPCLANLKFVSL
jgi:hypothetical protein